MRKIHASVIFVTYIRVHFLFARRSLGNKLTWQKKCRAAGEPRGEIIMMNFTYGRRLSSLAMAAASSLHACAVVLTIAS